MGFFAVVVSNFLLVLSKMDNTCLRNELQRLKGIIGLLLASKSTTESKEKDKKGSNQ